MAYTQAQIAKAERLIAKAMSLSQDIDPQRESIEKQLRAEIKKAYQGMVPAVYAGWDSVMDQIDDFKALGLEEQLMCRELEYLRIGDVLFEPKYSEAGLCLDQILKMPSMVPFIGHGKGTLIAYNRPTQSVALSLLQSLLLRIHALLPNNSHFTLLDPVGLGQAFPMQSLLPRKTEVGSHALEALREVVENIRRIRASVLGFEEGLHCLKEEELSKNPFEFLFAADIPKGYSSQDLESILNISHSGPAAGRYPIMSINVDEDLPHGHTLEGVLSKFHVVDLRSADASELFTLPSDIELVAGKNSRPLLYPDKTPNIADQRKLFDVMDKLKSTAKSRMFKDSPGNIGNPSNWWQGDSSHGISATIGKGERDVEVFFGVDSENRPCVHGMLAGMSGSGKSNLYHILVLALTTKYSPEELQLYFVDGKDGVEFGRYETLPHAAVVSLNSPPEMSRSVLADMIAEKERRNKVFIKNGVNDFSSFRKEKGGPMPRILLLVDEYQELFEGDTNGEASKMLLELSTQGRSAGIHMLLGSQRFSVPGMLNKDAIFGNFHLRIAMRLPGDVAQHLTEFEPNGRREIRAITNTGQIVVNSQAGHDSANKSGSVYLLDDSLKYNRISELLEREKANGSGVNNPPVVFKGDRQPSILGNKALVELAGVLPHDLVQKRESLLKISAQSGGFGHSDWSKATGTIGLCVGKEFSILKHAMLMLERRSSQNVLVVSSDRSAIQSMLSSIIFSSGVMYSGEELTITAFDGMPPGVEGEGGLLDTVNHLKTSFDRDCNALNSEEELSEYLIKRRDEIIKNKENNPGHGFPQTEVVVLAELDRVPSMRLNSDRMSRDSNPASEALQTLIREGSEYGIHVILVSSGVRQVKKVIDLRKDLQEFNHRIAFQMSRDDSFALVSSSAANQLQLGHGTVSAVYFNDELGGSKFLPYDGSSINSITPDCAEGE